MSGERAEASSYAETFDVVVRETDEYGETPPTQALVGAFDIGDNLALEDLAADLRAWLADKDQPRFAVQTRRSVAEVGATGIGTEILLTLLGAAGGVALTDVWEYLKGRIPGGRDAVRERAYLRELDAEDLAEQLGAMVARAIDARRAELRLINVSRDAHEIRGTFETSTGERYEIRSAGAIFEISRVENPNGGG